MSDNFIERSICQAIEIIANQKVAQANFDKTKKVIVQKALDETNGKYLVRYQDSNFTAWSLDSNITYATGDLVLLLSPNGKTDTTQIILGSANPTTKQYSKGISDKVYYNKVGTNAIKTEKTFQICSYDKTLPKIIYSIQNPENNEIDIDQQSLRNYINQGGAVVASCVLQTSLDTEQINGVYGVEIDYKYGRYIEDEFVGTIYTIDLNSQMLQGYPYGKTQPSKVETALLDIQPDQFIQITEIRLIARDFSKLDSIEGKENDIFISDLSIIGAQTVHIEKKGNYLLNIDYSTNGNRLNDNIKSVLLKAQIKIDGKQMTSTEGVQYYWFRENASILQGNERYFYRAGAGWEGITGLQKSGYSYKPAPMKINTYTFSSEEDKFDEDIQNFAYQALAKFKKNRIKCIVVFNGLQLQSTVIIYNDAVTDDFQIESSDKLANGENRTQYRMGQGSPTLTCKVEGMDTDGFTYNWLISPQKGSPSTVDKETSNKYENFSIGKNVNGKTLVGCSVKDNNGIYKGSASIILNNINQLEESYSLIIQNGNQVFKYDENGLSPCHPGLEQPLEIKPLSFTLIAPDGLEISGQKLDQSGAIISWYVPKEDSGTLLRYNKEATGNTDNFNIYQNLKQLPFAIADKYEGESFLNYIKLNIVYKGLSFDAYTDFTFAKDGDPGTNGTSYLAKISSSSDKWDSIYGVRIINENVKSFWRFFPGTGNITATTVALNNKIYYNGDVLSSGTSTTWTCPVKSVGQAWVEVSSSGTLSSSSNISANNPINIVRTDTNISNDLNIYAEYPIYFNDIQSTEIENSFPKYRFKVVPNSGFRYVKYNEDGAFPSYNQTDFEVFAQKLLDGQYTKMPDGQYICTWRGIGNLKTVSGTGKTKIIQPKDTFSGQDLTSCVIVDFKIDNKNVGSLYIPIYMYINRYNHKALNNWDGNSIDLGSNSGVILAPQIGAGKKDTNNTFTGVFMGEVKVDNSQPDVGLFGYNKGQRSIFLDAKTGNAQFGTNGDARINIGSSSVGIAPKGSLYSGNYYKYNETTGVPSSVNGQGMLINLTLPQIRFGSGKFYVNSNGELTAKGGGSIAGWKIEDNQLSSNNGNVKLNSTSTTAINAYNKFIVTSDGRIKATSGTIGGWTIGTSTLTGGNTTFNSNGSININNKFKVGTDGTLSATGADISGKITATSGKIGGWTINETLLMAQNGNNSIKLDSAGSIKGGPNNNPGWSIDMNGNATFNSGSIGGITITNNGLSGTGWYIRPGEAHFTGLVINNNGITSGGSGLSGGGGSIGSGGWTIPTGAGMSNGQSLRSFIVDSLNVSTSFTFQNVAVKWQALEFVQEIKAQGASINGTKVVTRIDYVTKKIYTLCAQQNGKSGSTIPT